VSADAAGAPIGSSLDRLKAARVPGESYSDGIIRLANGTAASWRAGATRGKAVVVRQLEPTRHPRAQDHLMENANPLVNRRQLMLAGSLAASAAASFDPAHKPAIGNLELTMELNKPLSLPAVLGTETSAAEGENHRILSLQLGELAAWSESS
jgi:hypothetical protein